MHTKTSAEPFLPTRINLNSLREAVQRCKGCDLYKKATQAVFGEGPRSASLILMGEVPGDEEDKQGHPFIGPAGRLLDDALDEAGISRDEVFILSRTQSNIFAGNRAASGGCTRNPRGDRSKLAARGFTLKSLSSNRKVSSALAQPPPKPCSAATFASRVIAASSTRVMMQPG
jgi:hypothetical protein